MQRYNFFTLCLQTAMKFMRQSGCKITKKMANLKMI